MKPSTKKLTNNKINLPPRHLIEDSDLQKDFILTPIVEKKIENLIKFFDSSGISYDKFDPDFAPKLNLDSKAYPNEGYIHVPGQRDTEKWLQTVRDIYSKEKDGISRTNAIKQATSGWDIMETYDFLNWIKYYESGDHLKYKFAQLWYENSTPGYFLPLNKNKTSPETGQKESIEEEKDLSEAKESADLSVAEKKRIIEKQRNKIIGRLDSAEKLLRTEDGQTFSGDEYETLLDAIYRLKKKIHTVNKVSTSTRLYEDMIVRESNILNNKGFVKAAGILYSLSQANNPPPANTGEPGPIENIPNPTTPDGPTVSSGSPGGLPSMGPGMPQNPPDSAPNENSPSQAISKFLENLETGNVTTPEDILEVSDEDSLEVSEKEDFISTAQGLPSPENIKPETTLNKLPKPVNPPATENPLEISEEDLENQSPNDKPLLEAQDFDNMINSAFSNLKVDDVINKLEDLAKIFKTREIPRQLSIVDMMLDSLGLAAYFPALAEATSKSLESNNYISTRVEDVLGMLRGAVEGNKVDLMGENQPVQNEEVIKIQKALKDNEDKEKEKKIIKKNLENKEKELDNKAPSSPPKETPEIDIAEDMGAPLGPSTIKPLPTPRVPLI